MDGSAMTVREAFSRAFGKVPDGATCHDSYLYFTEHRTAPVYLFNEQVYTIIPNMRGDMVWHAFNYDGAAAYGPDISDHAASKFLGSFGQEFANAVVKETYNNGLETKNMIELKDFTTEQLQAELDRRVLATPWKPNLDEWYYCVGECGSVDSSEWVDDSIDRERLAFGNCFPTKEVAELHSRRLRSMKPTCAMPKLGDKVFIAYAGGIVAEVIWTDEYIPAYYGGHIHQTSESAEAWVAKYSNAWMAQP